MDLGSAAQQGQTHGSVILPGFVPAAELKPALEELPAMYPTAGGFHDGTDEWRDRFTVGGWAGIGGFPFRSAELGLLAVSDRVIAYRPARAEWGQRMPWAGRSHEPGWYRFAHRATPMSRPEDAVWEIMA